MFYQSVFYNLQTRLLAGRVSHPCDVNWADSGATEYNDPFHRLYAVRAGEGTVQHHGRIFNLRPGYLYCIPAHVPGRYRCSDTMSLSWFHFQALFFGTLEPFEYFKWPYMIEAEEEDVQRLEGLINLHQHNTPADLLEADGMLRQVLSRFVRLNSAPKSWRHLSRLQPTLIYIENNLSSPLTLVRLAKTVNLQPTYFSNLFSAIMGVPPLNYINRKRMEKAAGLLHQGNMRVEEVALCVGYKNIYYFSKRFKALMGMPPTKYRAQIRDEA